MQGKYVYADYVTGKIRTLDYDEAPEAVVANEAVPSAQRLPITSFGEDE